MATALVFLSCLVPGVASQSAGAWSVDPDPLLRLGWIADRPDTEFFDVVAASWLPDGAIAVADRGLAMVTVVEADGAARFTVGGSGEGPGEFERLAHLLVDDRGHIHAFDAKQQRLTEWTETGVLVGSVTLSRAGTGRRLDATGRFESGGWYVREASRMVGAGVDQTARDTVGFFYLGDDGNIGKRIAAVPGIYATQVMVNGQAGIRHIMFSPRALDTRLADCLLVMSGDEPTIRVFGASGDLQSRISLPIPVRRTSEADRQLWIDGVIQSNNAPPAAAALVEGMGRELVMANVWPFANRIVADDAGYVWLERYAAPEGPSEDWIVLDGTGEVVAEMALPDGFRLLTIRGNKIMGVGSDELDRQEVRVYGLDREVAQPTALSECR